MTDSTERTHQHDDDPREAVIEPTPDAERSGNIREQQGTHAAGAVPAAFVGDGESGDKPEDSADDSGHWDELGRENPVKEPGKDES